MNRHLLGENVPRDHLHAHALREEDEKKSMMVNEEGLWLMVPSMGWIKLTPEAQEKIRQSQLRFSAEMKEIFDQLDEDDMWNRLRAMKNAEAVL